jgi:release factor glutamine methyltransferase
VQADWLHALAPGTFDLIISNPPYVECADARLRDSDIRFEPVEALASGHDGLAAIRSIVGQAGNCLRSGGWLLLEHGYNQAKRVRELFELAGFGHIATASDLAGTERATYGVVK